METTKLIGNTESFTGIENEPSTLLSVLAPLEAIIFAPITGSLDDLSIIVPVIWEKELKEKRKKTANSCFINRIYFHNFKRPKIPIILNYSTQSYEIALTQLFGFGPVKTRQLIESVIDLKLIFSLSYTELSKRTGINKSLLQKMEREAALIWAQKVCKDIEKFGINTIFYTDARYPRRLKQCIDAPLLLYSKGDVDLNDSKYVSIVGTRDASEYGKKICNELIESFIGSNIVVVSGLAYGIDIAVHKSCLKHKIPTIGVLAHGLEIIYPSSHQKTANEMLKHGALISEFPPFTNPDRENFPMRNRIVAGMCDATIIVESKSKGGSLITAELANDYNKDVFAYPGSVFDENSEGCNNLIASNKAHLIRNGADFLLKMGWNHKVKTAAQKSIFPQLSDEEKQIIELIQANPSIHIDSIAMALKIPFSKLSVLLFQLEMNGILRPIPGNKCQLL